MAVGAATGATKTSAAATAATTRASEACVWLTAEQLALGVLVDGERLAGA
jgi:hypothetical protein